VHSENTICSYKSAPACCTPCHHHTHLQFKIAGDRQTDALGHTGAKSSSVTVFHSLLSSDQSTKDLVDLTFDPRKLSQVAVSIIKTEKASSAEKAKQVKQDDERVKKTKARQGMSQQYSSNYISQTTS
jgi:hypothetical protein